MELSNPIAAQWIREFLLSKEKSIKEEEEEVFQRDSPVKYCNICMKNIENYFSHFKNRTHVVNVHRQLLGKDPIFLNVQFYL